MDNFDQMLNNEWSYAHENPTFIDQDGYEAQMDYSIIEDYNIGFKTPTGQNLAAVSSGQNFSVMPNNTVSGSNTSDLNIKVALPSYTTSNGKVSFDFNTVVAPTTVSAGEPEAFFSNPEYDLLTFEESIIEDGRVILLPMPEAEYMYGCSPTAISMIMAYYSINGYRGENGLVYQAPNLFDGPAELNSRALDGNPYNMNSFDTYVGSMTASRRHVAEFFEVDPETQYYNSFSTQNVYDQSRWDCLADYMGTNQFWRYNEAYGTMFSTMDWTVEYMETYGVFGTITYGNLTADVRFDYIDGLCGLAKWAESRGYALIKSETATLKTDNNGGKFTFEDYMAQIDAGHLVQVGIEGHAMVGYGYDRDTKTIYIDDTYEKGTMAWGGSYYYAGENRKMLDMGVIKFDTSKFESPEDHDAPDTPTLFAPQISGNDVTLNWTAVYDKSGVFYQLEYADNALFANSKVIKVDTNTYTLADLADGNYYWRLRAVDNATNASNWATGKSFFVDITPPEAPDNLFVDVNGRTVRFAWSPVYDLSSVYYEFEYAKDGDFANAERMKFTDRTAFSLINIATGNYQWRVRGVDGAGNIGAWSYGETFVSDISLPERPASSLVEVSGNKVDFSWSQVNDTTGATYRLMYATKTDFSDAVTVDLGKTPNYTANITGDGVYYWRIQTTDGFGNKSNWMFGDLFRIDTLAPDANQISGIKMVNSNSVRVTWTETFDLSEVTMNARYGLVDSSKSIMVDGGFTGVTLSNLSDGVYWVQSRAIDGAGNQAKWSEKEYFIIQNSFGNTGDKSQVIAGNFYQTNSTQLVTADSKTGKVYITPSGEGARELGNLAANWNLVDSGNFFNNGGDDVLVFNSENGLLAAWNQVNGEVKDIASIGLLTSGWEVAGVADFDGNGISDLLLHNRDNGLVTAWTLQNGTLQNSNAVGILTDGWNYVGAGDFNGNGQTDILLSHNSGLVATWCLDEGEMRLVRAFGMLSDEWSFAGIGDFNGDKTSDVLLYNKNSGALAAWMVKGTMISNVAILGVLSADQELATIGDFNGDGIDDLALKSAGSSELTGQLINNNYFGSTIRLA